MESCKTHLSNDKTVAKMGHPILRQNYKMYRLRSWSFTIEATC